MQSKLIAFAVPTFVVAVLLLLAPFAFAQTSSMAPYEGPVICASMDTMQCPDGSWIPRTGPNCEFVCPGNEYPTYGDDTPDQPTQDDDGPPFPTYGDDTPPQGDNGTMCAADEMRCPDGSWIARSGPDCAFICPKNVPVESEQPLYDDYGRPLYPTYGDDTQYSDGNQNSDPCYYTNWIWINPCNYPDAGWTYPNDPNLPNEPVMCTMDAMQCPDGSYVGRSGSNCEFVCPGVSGDQEPYPTYGDDTSSDPNTNEPGDAVGDPNYSGSAQGTINPDGISIDLNDQNEPGFWDRMRAFFGF